jgi:putative transposase
MYFKPGSMYHVYNQENNRQVIFFKRENYFFFLRKIKIFIHPFADILAYCLMPNHFHLMIYVNETQVPAFTVGVTNSDPDGKSKLRTLNSSIGIMLRSYTRAINKQEKRSGALFREETKAICLNEPKWDIPNWYTSAGITIMKVDIREFQYPQVCFNYIHNNPVKSGIVEHPGNWPFSSFAEIQEIRDASLVNLEKVKEFGLLTG